ncbi:MAG: glycoside hydrolase family 44 protein [Janthinobacterium lividum]
MNKRFSLICAGLSAAGLTLASIQAANSQAGLPPPPPPIGPGGNNAAPPPALPQPGGNPNIPAAVPEREEPETLISIDAAAGRHAISPLIYGVAFADKAQLLALNAPLNRSGGNAETRYNWRLNASNHAADWYFESIAEQDTVPGAAADSFVADSKAGGARPMLTIPMIGWVAKLGPNRQTLPGFSVAKYGPQQKTDPGNPDFGNGVKPDGKTNIAGDDPNDANVPATPEFQRGWITHLTTKWDKSAAGGVGYYLYDNEPSLWSSTHRDAHPKGETMDELRNDIFAYGTMIKAADPNAKLLGPEEWGWPGYFYSGSDLQYQGAHNYQGHPDKDAHGGMDMIPWLLTQLHQHQQQTGQRLLDILTVHIYPQGGDGGDDVTPAIQTLRNRSTRALWDPNYTDESWIKDKIMLIPRLKNWVTTYYPGTQIGVTEYNWGAEKNIGGATAQADILGIFGREGVDVATRWTCPDAATPTFKAMQMYRNYDGHDSPFGSISVSDSVPNPDTLSSFASVRSSDGALTVMVINKSLTGPKPILLSLSHFAGSAVTAWQLTSANAITKLPNAAVRGGRISATLPAQSITLFVVSAQTLR